MTQTFSKKISVGKEARDKIYTGVKVLTDLVGSTLGPGGRLVVIKRTQHPLDVPFATKDGKTVAESIFLDDEFEDAGAQLVKDVSLQTCKEAGDGTTTACVLAHSMFKQGLDAIEEGANPVLLKKGMDAAVEVACKNLKLAATPVSDEDVIKVAMISANGDEDLANLISSAVIRAGKNGVVELSFSNTIETKIKVVDGCQLLSGWVSSTFITDPRLEESILEDPYILIVGKKLQSISEMLEPKNGQKPLLEQISDQQRSLLIIAEDIQGEALATLTYNHKRGILKCCAIRTPGYKDAGRELLEDVAALTGATVITDDLGMKLSSIGFEHLGEAGTVKVSQQITTILDGKSDPTRLAERIEGIQLAQARETDQAEVERLQLRLSHLSGGVVTVLIGGKTELEVREKYYRAEDAMHAVQVARESGTVEGAGMALSRAAESIDLEGNKDFLRGVAIVKQAMTQPRDKILENAGYNPEEVVSTLPAGMGFDSINGVIGDLRAFGVIDPLKVVLSAFQNAESISSTMILTEGLVVPPSGNN